MPAIREVAHGSADYAACVRLRDRILREPLGLAFTDEELARECHDWHLAGYSPGDDAGPVACLVLAPLGEGAVKMRQVAVSEDSRGRGYGKEIVRFAERFAAARGISEIVLNARENVLAFYEKLGYTTEGEMFTEVTIPHRTMRKRLAPPSSGES